jgi:hypothetical protein
LLRGFFQKSLLLRTLVVWDRLFVIRTPISRVLSGLILMASVAGHDEIKHILTIILLRFIQDKLVTLVR